LSLPIKVETNERWEGLSALTAVTMKKLIPGLRWWIGALCVLLALAIYAFVRPRFGGVPSAPKTADEVLVDRIIERAGAIQASVFDRKRGYIDQMGDALRQACAELGEGNPQALQQRLEEIASQSRVLARAQSVNQGSFMTDSVNFELAGRQIMRRGPTGWFHGLYQFNKARNARQRMSAYKYTETNGYIRAGNASFAANQPEQAINFYAIALSMWPMDYEPERRRSMSNRLRSLVYSDPMLNREWDEYVASFRRQGPAVNAAGNSRAK